MNKVLVLLMLAMVLAIVKAVLTALVIILLLVLAWALAARPGETLVWLGSGALFSLASARPTVFIIALGLLGVVVLAAPGVKGKALQPPLLAGRRDER